MYNMQAVVRKNINKRDFINNELSDKVLEEIPNLEDWIYEDNNDDSDNEIKPDSKPERKPDFSNIWGTEDFFPVKKEEHTETEIVEKLLENIKIEIKREGEDQIIFLDGEDVSTQIRTPDIDACVAKFAALACVRKKMTPMQREMGQKQDIIMEGRDIGTAVFPNADVKIYLDASVEERAKRRYKQNLEKGINISYEEVLDSIIKRHKLETEREIAPLVQAEDAIYLDSSHLTIEEVVERVIEIINTKR